MEKESVETFWALQEMWEKGASTHHVLRNAVLRPVPQTLALVPPEPEVPAYSQGPGRPQAEGAPRVPPRSAARCARPPRLRRLAQRAARCDADRIVRPAKDATKCCHRRRGFAEAWHPVTPTTTELAAELQTQEPLELQELPHISTETPEKGKKVEFSSKSERDAEAGPEAKAKAQPTNGSGTGSQTRSYSRPQASTST